MVKEKVQMMNTTTITLENASNEFLSLFKGLAKVANVNFKIKKAKKKSKEKEFYTLKELDELPFMQELKKWEKEHPKEVVKLKKQVDKEMGLI